MWVSICVGTSTTVGEVLDALTKEIWLVAKKRLGKDADQAWLLLRSASEDFFMDTLREIAQTDGNKIMLRFELFDERKRFEDLLTEHMLQTLQSIMPVNTALRNSAKDAIRRKIANSILREEVRPSRRGRT